MKEDNVTWYILLGMVCNSKYITEISLWKQASWSEKPTSYKAGDVSAKLFAPVNG